MPPPLAPPNSVGLTVIPPHPCPYLPDQRATLRAFHAQHLDPALYQGFLDASFRRSGQVIYQPVCERCRACLSLRVPTSTFQPSKSQRRCLRRNSDLKVAVGHPEPSDEKYELYRRYQAERHDPGKPESRSDFVTFLYQSPVETVEFCYRDADGKLAAVGICDVAARSLSSVYFYFDPAQSRRGLGTYGALVEIDFARRCELAHYYLGFWVRDCRKMKYKADFRPCEVLHPDGSWQPLND